MTVCRIIEQRIRCAHLQCKAFGRGWGAKRALPSPRSRMRPALPGCSPADAREAAPSLCKRVLYNRPAETCCSVCTVMKKILCKGNGNYASRMPLEHCQRAPASHEHHACACRVCSQGSRCALATESLRRSCNCTRLPADPRLSSRAALRSPAVWRWQQLSRSMCVRKAAAQLGYPARQCAANDNMPTQTAARCRECSNMHMCLL